MWNVKDKTNCKGKKETDSHTQKTQLPVGKGEGQDRGMRLRDTNYYVLNR